MSMRGLRWSGIGVKEVKNVQIKIAVIAELRMFLPAFCSYNRIFSYI